MNVFIAVTSAHEQYVAGILSCAEMDKENGDKTFIQHSSHGYMARNELATTFLEHPEYDAILLLDADMRHPEDALKKLRAHELDIVCGHYFKRQTDPMQSAMLELNPLWEWPCFSLMDVPQEGLLEIASGGFGIALLSRRVVEAVTEQLGGPNELFTNGHVAGLESEGTFGSDVRFFLTARQLGYKVWLDCSVESLHGTVAWLGRELYGKIRDDEKLTAGMMGVLAHHVEEHGVSIEAFKARKTLLERYRGGILKQLEPAKTAGNEQELGRLSVLLYKTDARIEEMDEWIAWWTKYPRIDSPGLLPTLETEQDIQLALQNRRGTRDVPAPPKAERLRRGVYKRQSEEFVDELQKTGDDEGRDQGLQPHRGGPGEGRSEGGGPEGDQPDGGEPAGSGSD